MSLSKGTKSWKYRYYLLLFLFLGGLATLIYFYGFSYLEQRSISSLEKEIQSQHDEIDLLYQNTGFKEFLVIKNLEDTKVHMPWSEYVNEILSILSRVKSIEDGKGNVTLSDFKVTLQELSLNGVVMNLKVLYLPDKNGSGSLLDHFNNLEFLKDIAIRSYEKNKDTRGFNFTLSAKVVNDARK